MKTIPTVCATWVAIAGLALFGSAAGAATLDFESLSDLDPVTTQFAGLTFSNTTALTAGVSLNEFEFPPNSGNNVVFDDGGAITIVFDALQASVGGYFTYLVPLTLSAFDAGAGLLGSVTSAFGSNLALSGDAGSSPNELLSLLFPSGIKKITLEADAAGASFTLDDLTYEPAPAGTVPEPSALLLLAGGLIGIAIRQLRR